MPYTPTSPTSQGARFKQYINQVIPEIESGLSEELARFTEEGLRISPDLAPLFEAFVRSSDGGKRIRSALVKYGYQMVAGTLHPAINQAAVAFEIMQTSILAHDDLIDQSELRRGLPTLYQRLGNDHRGSSQTVTLADLGYFWTYRMLAELQLPADRVVAGLGWFAQAMVRTATGQVFDVELPYLDHRTERDALTAYAWKTGWYTVTAPICMGATYAGMDMATLRALVPATQAAGIAFQIHDDILGVFGNEDLTKKSVNADIVEGKHTVLSAYAFAEASVGKREVLERLYGNPEIDAEGVATVREVLWETGALAHAQALARHYVAASLELLTEAPLSQTDKAMLASMAYFFIERSA